MILRESAGPGGYEFGVVSVLSHLRSTINRMCSSDSKSASTSSSNTNIAHSANNGAPSNPSRNVVVLVDLSSSWPGGITPLDLAKWTRVRCPAVPILLVTSSESDARRALLADPETRDHLVGAAWLRASLPDIVRASTRL